MEGSSGWDALSDCDGSAGDVDGLESEEQMVERRVSNAAIEGVESLALSLLQAGVVEFGSPEFAVALEVALDAIGNNA